LSSKEKRVLGIKSKKEAQNKSKSVTKNKTATRRRGIHGKSAREKGKGRDEKESRVIYNDALHLDGVDGVFMGKFCAKNHQRTVF
jgi:hypothetical protein